MKRTKIYTKRPGLDTHLKRFRSILFAGAPQEGRSPILKLKFKLSSSPFNLFQF